MNQDQGNPGLPPGLMKIWASKVAIWFLPLAFFGGMITLVLFGVVPSDEKHGILPFLLNFPTVVLQTTGYVILALAALYFMQWVRVRGWFDRHSSAQEMKEIQDRLGTPDERPGDGQACARQNAGNSIMCGLIVLGLFLGHMT